MTAYDTVKASIGTLTLDEKERLVRELSYELDLDEEERPAQVVISEYWKAEIARRVQEIHDGTDPGVDGAEVLRKLREKFK